MICTACKEGRHDECEDAVRRAEYEKWATAELRKTRPSSGAAEEIHRLRPYKSCACLHRPTPKAEPPPLTARGPVFSAPIAP